MLKGRQNHLDNDTYVMVTCEALKVSSLASHLLIFSSFLCINFLQLLLSLHHLTPALLALPSEMVTVCHMAAIGSRPRRGEAVEAFLANTRQTVNSVCNLAGSES